MTATLTFLYLLITTTLVESEVFTALSHLERLVNIELELADALEEFITEQEARLKMLKSFAEDVSSAMDQAKEDRYAYLGHPVSSFLMVKRFVNQWSRIETSIQQEGDSEGLLMDKFENYRDYFPKQDDLEGAMAAVKRLQDVYNLKPFDFTGGKYGIRTDSGSLLTAMDSFKIGRAAFVTEDMKSTQQWMAESLRQMDYEGGIQKELPNRFTVLDHLAWSSYQLGDVRGAINYTTAALKILPNHERSRINLGNFMELRNQMGDKETKTNEKEPTFNYLARRLSQTVLKNFDWHEERRIYKRLCRGEPMPKAPQSPERLKCFYKTNTPLCIIKRCPIEVVFTNPDIMIFHRIMTAPEIDKVIEISKPLLNRATVHNPITGELEYAHYRISKNCWLNGDHDELIAKINRRMEALTGLNLDTAEDFQVQNYGIAGHYDPHFDFSRDLENSSLGRLGTGNRIATVLLYMSDVEVGGATVFPYVGTRILPKKGDAVFWHNLLKSGEGDFRTRHAGCPILKGIKWVANKWIHEHGNEFHRPCSLSPLV